MTKTIFVSVYIDSELYEKCVTKNKFVKDSPNCTIHGFDNVKKNQAIPILYNQFLDGYDYSQPAWFIFCHSDWELREEIMPLLERLDRDSLYGPIGAIIYQKSDGTFTREYRGQCFEKKRDGTAERQQLCPVNYTGVIVDTFDCQCLIVHSTLVARHELRFDEKLAFDLYVEDFCIQAKELHGIESKILNVQCCHWSQVDSMDGREQYFSALKYLNAKYPEALYAGVVTPIGGKSEPLVSEQIVPAKNYVLPFHHNDDDGDGRGTIYHVNVDPAAVNDSRSMLFRYVNKGAAILDVGCACGDLGKALHRYKGCACYGFEYSQDSIDVALRSHTYEKISQVDLNALKVDDFPSYMGKFDYIIFGDVLEHVYDPGSVLQKMRNYLKPEGRVLISLPNLAHASIKAGLLLNNFTYTDVGLLDKTHIRFFTHKSIPAFLAKRHIVIEDYTYVVSDVLGFQPENPYADISIPVKQALFHDPHSFVSQYVMKVKHAPEASFADCMAANSVLHTLDESRNPVLATYRDSAFATYAPLDGSAALIRRLRAKPPFRDAFVKAAIGAFLLPASLEYAGGAKNWLRRMRTPKAFLAEVSQYSFVVTENLKHRNRLYRAFVQRSLDVGRTLKITNSVRATVRKCAAKIGSPKKSKDESPEGHRYAAYIKRCEPHAAEHFSAIEAVMAALPRKALLSLHIHADEDNLTFLPETLQSLIEQRYCQWELFITAAPQQLDAATILISPYKERQIRLLAHDAASDGLPEQTALAACSGEFFIPVGCGDSLSAFALYMVAKEAAAHPDARLIYSDADVVEGGVRRSPFFKPQWNEELMLEQDYICRLAAYKTTFLKKIGGFSAKTAPCQLYDAALRIAHGADASKIRHIPWVLYHYSHDSFCLFSGEERERGRRVVQDYLDGRGVNANVTSTPYGTNHVSYDVAKPLPLVSCIIGMRDKAAMTRDCVMGLLKETDYNNLEILLVDNESVEAKSFELFEELEEDGRVRVIRWERPFNYAEIQNMGAREAKGEYLALLNNDILFKDQNWLREMVGHAQKDHVGAVGAKLLFENDTLQHGGIILGPNGLVGHTLRTMPESTGLQRNIAHCARWISAVTGACLVVNRQKYMAVGGLNEQDLTVGYNDVDFCIRLFLAGYKNIYTPHVHIYHLESISRGYDLTPEKKARVDAEIAYISSRYGSLLHADPQYNPNLSFIGTNYDVISETETPRHDAASHWSA